MVILSRKDRLIKKYKNRRLYDSEISKYITIDDLQRYVMDGLSFQVVDAATSNDITNATLLQIFVEMEANSTQFLSSAMLRQLIVLSNHPMSNAFKTMLEKTMLMMENQQVQTSYLSDYQKATEVLSQQTQEFLNQWNDIFKSRT